MVIPLSSASEGTWLSFAAEWALIRAFPTNVSSVSSGSIIPSSPAPLILTLLEELPPISANIVSARALAPLKTLCLYAKNHLEKDGVAVFAKGENWKAELVEAQKKWIFSYEAVKSTLHEGSVVLVLRGIKSV